MSAIASSIHYAKRNVADEEDRAARQAHLQQAESDLEPLPFDAAAARSFGQAAASLRRAGRKPSARAYDAMIAAIAPSRGLPVHTCNPADFDRIDDLEVVAARRKCRLTGNHLVTYNGGVKEEDVFKALADPTRRALLDALFVEDGQTLRALTASHDMTRIAVAKHLGVLERAGLVRTQRHGREKHHFLNPVPIRLVHDRWVSKYTEGWAAGLAALKHELERNPMEKVFEIYIRTTPERLWEAITDSEVRARFQFGAKVSSDWTPDSGYAVAHRDADGPLVDGTNLEVDPPRRLVQTFHAHWSDGANSAGTSRVTWEIEPVADSCRLTVIHDQLPPDAAPDLYGGWPMLLSGLKTWLETGTTLTTPGSLMYRPDHSQETKP